MLVPHLNIHRFKTSALLFASPTREWQHHVNESTSPKKKIVFLKTYKTASTTITSILERYGLSHNLSFLLPASGHAWFSRTERFNRDMPILPPMPNTSYSMLVGHVPFKKDALEELIPNATYVTIIREPVATYESIFGFFNIAHKLGIRQSNSTDSLGVFLLDPEHYIGRANDNFQKTLLRNRQMFDIGLDVKNYDNQTVISDVITRAATEFDLVMIAEYFDESLLLLRKLLSWEFEDIVYLRQNVRSDALRYEIDDWKRQQILKLNAADVKLYQYFNRTLWKTIETYGESFADDLARFRSMLWKIQYECLDVGRFVITYKNRRNDTLLKDHAPSYCSDINQFDRTKILSSRQKRSRRSSKKRNSSQKRIALLRNFTHYKQT
ncbi:galactosylceramide sulfotransferase-like [Saccoglossus kowalevskii]|uniref:Galactosylceramide sulfotransferase-like n=1 Tax=Saccoglossus kowalevskii TaxID=10224 RepID=A0ABM0GUX7_SACKO|nr:PREDICTED: galactosylceramide sulfotransferase-like [Saccoglossus kowalevskii]